MIDYQQQLNTWDMIALNKKTITIKEALELLDCLSMLRMYNLQKRTQIIHIKELLQDID